MPKQLLRWNFVRFVAWKELLSTFRDKRTLTTTILLPFILPLFMVFAGFLASQAISGTQKTQQVIGVVGLERMPSTFKTLLEGNNQQNTGVKLETVVNANQAVRDGQYDAVIVMPSKLPVAAGATPVPVEVHFKKSNQKAQLIYEKISGAVNAYAQGLTRAKLRQAGLPEQILTPVIASPVDVDSAAESISGIIAGFIPYLLFTFLIAGGQATAIDATAGEKERGTLEALIVTPVSRLEIVSGKVLSVLFFSCLGAVFSVLGMLFAGLVAIVVLPRLTGANDSAGQAIGVLFSQGFAFSSVGLIAVLFVLLSLALVISGLLMTVCIYARSFKEAQTYMTPVLMVIILPLALLQFSDFLARGAGLYVIPVIGSALAIIDVLKGNFSWLNVLTALSMNLVLSAVLIAFAFSSFKREQVLFRN